MATNWSDITYSLLDTDQDIMLKIECIVLDHTYKKTHSRTKGNRKLLSENSALELNLDINEIQELQAMCTQPLLRNILMSIIVQLETI
jgi:hypothetical protein